MYVFSFFPFLFGVVVLLGARPISRGVFFLFSLATVATFVFVYGLRDYSSGTDSVIYAVAYESGDFHRWEPGYVVWLQALRCLGESYTVYFAAGTCLKLGLLVWSAYNVSKAVGYALGALFLLLVVYTFALFDLYTNGLRQGLAMTVSILGASFYFRGRSGWAVTVSALAPLVHLSYLVYFVFYVLAFVLVRAGPVFKVPLIVAAALAPAFLVLGVDLLPLAGPLLLDAGSILGAEAKVRHYLSLDFGSFSSLNINGAIKVLALLGVGFCVSMVLMRSKLNSDKLMGSLLLSLVAFYGIIANAGFSYRVLYMVAGVLPFVVVGAIRFIDSSVMNRNLSRALTSLVLFCSFLNYLYFVVIRGGLMEFGYAFGG